MQKVVIVTGAGGFIGKAVCRKLLRENIKVFAVARDKQQLIDIQHPLLHIIISDMMEYRDLLLKINEEIDVFYHFAWEGSSGFSLTRYSQQIQNISYTCDSLVVASKIGCKKFIMAGTINELELFQYFEAETNIPRPSCIYGIAKLSCDFMCKTLAAQMKMNFNTAIIGSCFGPGDRSKRIHNVFISNILKGKSPKLVNAENLNDWIYIDDVADMLFEVGRTSVNMKNYYIGHDVLLPLKDILLEVRDVLNPGLQIKFGELEENYILDYSLVNINAVYEDTGYRCNSNFADSVLKTAEWIKKQRI